MLPAVSSSDFNKSFASLIFKCDPLLLFIASVSKRNAFPGRGSDNISRWKPRESGIGFYSHFLIFPFLNVKSAAGEGSVLFVLLFFL